MALRKTIIPIDTIKMIFSSEEYERSLNKDLEMLSAVIKMLDGEITVRHFCTHKGQGYFSVLAKSKYGCKRKVYIQSEYELQSFGGEWNASVYERLYFAQLWLTKYLNSLKAALNKKYTVHMPIKALYIAYILKDLDIKEQVASENDCSIKDIIDNEIAYKHRKSFIKNYAEEIEEYNITVRNGSDFFRYYNEELELTISL